MKRTLLLIVILGLLAAACGGGSTATLEPDTQHIATVSPNEAYQIIQDHQGDANFELIDVRTPDEYAAGKIDGAIDIDFYDPAFRDALAQLDRNKTYVIYCRSGNRSGQTLDIMRELGFTDVVDVQGGIAAWAESGLPIVP